ncbi:MAG: hypothetical protein V4481_03420 [Patescibacteria group bacterium]
MDTNENPNSAAFNDPVNWKSIGFFSAEDYLIYIFKKTEKIAAALYLVSGLLKDNEPIKWELRDHGMDLISSSFLAASSVPGDKNAVIQSLFTAALETMSLLNVARISNLISDMNYKLVIKEIDQVVGLLRDKLAQNAENAGYVLSESFFKTPDMYTSGFRADTKSNGYKGQAFSGKNSYKSSSNQTDQASSKRTERQEIILNLLKGKPGLTIKDFSQVIKDCSEKTIQRELLDLVERGLVKKEGERRWSTYSLK